MKFPKLRNAVISQILLYLPVPLLAGTGIYLSYILDTYTDAPTLVWLLVFFAGLILPLVYLFSNFPLFLLSDYLFFSIRAWQRDRSVFITDCNGSSAESIKNLIASRCRRFGKSCCPAATEYTPEIFVHRHSSSNTAYYTCIERYVMVFSVDELDEERFDRIIQAARANLLPCFSDEYTRHSNKSRDIHPALCAAVIILAGTVSGNMSETARREITTDHGCILPCVVDCSSARYYFNARDEFYMLGAAGKPEKNFAVDIVKKVVFSGKLPSGHEENRPEDDPLNGKDTTLWEYIAAVRKELRTSDREAKKELDSVAETLSDGDVVIGKYAIYCKLGGRIAALSYTTDDENSRQIDILPPSIWVWPKKSDISARDIDDICRTTEKILTDRGYECSFCNEQS